jgi:polar amino acid transport system permease protein
VKLDLSFSLEILPALLRGAIVTAEATFGGMALALVGGLVLALGRRSRLPGVSRLAASYVLFMRNTPLLVQIYFLFYVLPFAGITFGALTTGILALGLNYSAYIAEVYRAGIDGVPQGQWEAARALDFSPGQTWTRVILPQALPPMLPVLGNYLIGMFKDSPLLATITVPEMFAAAEHIAGETYRYNEPYTLVGLIFLCLSYPASLAVRQLEKRFGKV